MAHGMDRAVNGISRRIDAIAGPIHHIAVQIDFHQIGRAYLAIGQAIGIDQKMLRLTRHAGGDVIIDLVDPAMGINQSIACRQINPHRPFRI